VFVIVVRCLGSVESDARIGEIVLGSAESVPVAACLVATILPMFTSTSEYVEKWVDGSTVGHESWPPRYETPRSASCNPVHPPVLNSLMHRKAEAGVTLPYTQSIKQRTVILPPDSHICLY
jgi:hypothetical protein